MKKTLFYFLAMCFLVSCDEDKADENTSTTLGGDANIELNQVGNTFSPGGISIGDSSISLESSMEIISTDNGVNTIKMVVDLTKSPELAPFNNLIPSQYKDTLGRLNTQVKVKMTSEGMLDYTNKDGAPFVAVKYSGNVGDQYKLTKSDGKVITRTVIQKSTDDDFSWGFYNIKTISVEQDSRLPGIRKFVYRFNHKFGLVGFEIHGEDRSVLSGLIFPKYP